MSRIIAGQCGSLTLAHVPGNKTRPTTDRVKESLFSRLEGYEVLSQGRVLDLFGGSGALGCESLSRGARHVDFVDSSSTAIATIRENVARVSQGLNSAASTMIYTSDAQRFLERYQGEPWDVVFVDPPYDMPNEQVHTLLSLIKEHLSDDAVVVVERSSRMEPVEVPAGLEEFRQKKYGETILYYVQLVS
ncbi:16S rRNA (guanine(966)-N(2))-methyltransferase RsmD [Rothia sp. P7181]|uniref:16S rRNA (guanine(966)-N(2))-methyltransferase RsmD n=1 Tax=unclassified Rothia (in: high G+C Gram-positive bacteria) TaxID=2689056 RepID=UPI003AE8A810